MDSDTSEQQIACVYCPEDGKKTFPPKKGSLEHVILSALGGRKGSRNICCMDCNNRLGLEIDDVLARTFAPLANQFNIQRDRRGAAPIIASKETLDGAQLEVGPGGQYRLKKATVTESETADGRPSFYVQANNLEEADRLRGSYLKKFGPNAQTTTEYFATSTPAPLHAFELKFGDAEKRSSAKMLLTLLATSVHPDRIRSDELRDIVRYINGEINIGHRVQPWLNIAMPATKEEYRFGHVALVVASAELKQLVGVLLLFGTFKVTVLLSDSWSGPALGVRYCVDPCSGHHDTDRIDGETLAQSFPQSEIPCDADLGADIGALIGELQERQRTKLIMGVIEEVKARIPEGASQEEIKRIVDEAANRLTKELLKIPYKRRLDL
nr:HNH endonuclease [Dyella sp. ASV24]